MDVDSYALSLYHVSRLLYDASTNSFHNNTNVKIHVPGFGNTNGVEYLTTVLLPYLHEAVEYFVDRGYKRGKTIRAAPYDWRLAAGKIFNNSFDYKLSHLSSATLLHITVTDELEKRGYFHRLKSMIEDMYETNGNTKVTLVVHSMGGLVSLHFLTGFSGINQAWKDKYIHAYVTLSAAWSGGASALQTVISGIHNTHSFLLFANDYISDFVVPIVRTLESIPWLFPKTSVFGNEVFVSTPSKNYTASDYENLFGNIGYTNGYLFFQGVQALVTDFPAPNVSTYCYYGVGVNTPKKLSYEKDFRSGVNTIGLTPTTIFSDGDGTVNIESSRVCHGWSSMKPQYNFSHKAYNEVDHSNIIKDEHVLNDIARIVGAPRKRKSFWERLFG